MEENKYGTAIMSLPRLLHSRTEAGSINPLRLRPITSTLLRLESLRAFRHRSKRSTCRGQGIEFPPHSNLVDVLVLLYDTRHGRSLRRSESGQMKVCVKTWRNSRNNGHWTISTAAFHSALRMRACRILFRKLSRVQASRQSGSGGAKATQAGFNYTAVWYVRGSICSERSSVGCLYSLRRLTSPKISG